MTKKIILYLSGVLLGILLVKFLFGGRNIACSYFPSERVKDNILKKELKYSEFALCQKRALGLSEISVDSLVMISDVLFSESKIRGESCPEYVLRTRNNAFSIYMVVRNCTDGATLVFLDTARQASVRCP